MFKLIVAIVPKDQCDAIYQAAKEAGAPGGTIIPGRGTAPSSVLSLLGFGDSSKEILLTVVPDSVEGAVRQAIIDECQKKKGRSGVLFAVDTGAFIKGGSDSNFSLEEKSMPNNNSYQMINIIVNKGYAEDAMAAARRAGAGGGTVFGGRGTAKEGDAKFFGVEIVPGGSEVTQIGCAGRQRRNFDHVFRCVRGKKGRSSIHRRMAEPAFG